MLLPAVKGYGLGFCQWVLDDSYGFTERRYFWFAVRHGGSPWLKYSVRCERAEGR